MTVAVAVAAAKTSTGTQDITTSDLGGETPKAVVFLFSRANAHGVINDHAGPSFGMASATAQVACCGVHKDAAASGFEVAKVAKTDKCLVALTPSKTLHSEAGFDSFITNGVRVNWTTATTDAWLITALFFSGSDWDVQLGDITAPVSPGTDVTTGWQPSCIIMMGASHNMNGTIFNSRINTSFGFQTWPGGVGSACSQTTWNWGITRQNVITNSDFNPVYHWEPASAQYGVNITRSGTGFNATAQVGATTGDFRWGYLALKYNGTGRLQAGLINPTTSSGAQAFTGFGGNTSQFVILLPTQTTTGNFFIYKFGMAFHTATKTGGFATGSISDGQQVDLFGGFPQDHHNTANEDGFNMLSDTGTVNLTYTFTSFDSDGFTLNFSNAPDDSVYLWPYLTIVGEEAAPAGTPGNQAWIID